MPTMSFSSVATSEPGGALSASDDAYLISADAGQLCRQGIPAHSQAVSGLDSGFSTQLPHSESLGLCKIRAPTRDNLTMRHFQYQGVQWSAELSGGSHGVGSAYPPRMTSFGVVFRCVVGVQQETVTGSIRTRDLAALTDDDLRAALETALSRAAGSDV